VKLTFSNESFMVLDDFLSKEDFKHVWNFMQEETFQHVHSEKWIKAFQLSDNNPLWGTVYISDPVEYDQESSVYPSSKGIDVLIKTMLDNITKLEPYVGKKYEDWDYVFARPYIYPKNTGLSWHTDGRSDMSGAYVYYTHPIWKAQWGSELLMHNSHIGKVKYPEIAMYNEEKKILGFHMENQKVSDLLMDEGIGYYVLPKPNRMVVLKPGIIHRINRVDENAGENLRSSITGFFLRKRPELLPKS
jgi:hypothetical protein